MLVLMSGGMLGMFNCNKRAVPVRWFENSATDLIVNIETHARFNKEDSNVAHACRKNDSAESEQFCKLCLYTGGGNLVYDAIISFVVENAGEMHFDCLIAQVHDELSSKCDLRLTHAVLVPGLGGA